MNESANVDLHNVNASFFVSDEAASAQQLPAAPMTRAELAESLKRLAAKQTKAVPVKFKFSDNDKEIFEKDSYALVLKNGDLKLYYTNYNGIRSELQDNLLICRAILDIIRLNAPDAGILSEDDYETEKENFEQAITDNAAAINAVLREHRTVKQHIQEFRCKEVTSGPISYTHSLGDSSCESIFNPDGTVSTTVPSDATKEQTLAHLRRHLETMKEFALAHPDRYPEPHTISFDCGNEDHRKILEQLCNSNDEKVKFTVTNPGGKKNDPENKNKNDNNKENNEENDVADEDVPELRANMPNL